MHVCASVRARACVCVCVCVCDVHGTASCTLLPFCFVFCLVVASSARPVSSGCCFYLLFNLTLQSHRLFVCLCYSVRRVRAYRGRCSGALRVWLPHPTVQLHSPPAHALRRRAAEQGGEVEDWQPDVQALRCSRGWLVGWLVGSLDHRMNCVLHYRQSPCGLQAGHRFHQTQTVCRFSAGALCV